AKVLITTYARLHELAEVLAEARDLETIIAMDGDPKQAPGFVGKIKILDWQMSLWQFENHTLTMPPVVETDLAAILYTSGSTGNPKGVVLTHLNIVAGAKKVSEYLKITEQDRLISILTFSFDYGLNQLTSAFLQGAQVVLLDYLFPRDIIKAVAAYNVTGLAAVAATWNQLVQLSWTQRDVPSLRYITNSGGKIPENFVRELRRRLPDTSIYLMYGLTEAFRSTYLDPSLVDERPTSIGKVIPGEEILVVDENGKPVPPGGVGELVHRGVLVAQGYWDDPELTRVRFRPNPLQPSEVPIKETVVFSGDQVRIDEAGFLYFVGRKDEMIKTAGNRVSPTEVEEVIYSSNKVQDAVVLGVPHEVYGEIIRAIVSPRNGLAPSETEIIAHCKKYLPLFMLPTAVEIWEALPRNANDKLDRARVRKEVLSRLPALK
ncbi:MAG: AMP-binding protein, partial [Anaerolineae bacterium]|nr:AMP-binding protein [Anaerolineae bacterium]